MPNVTGLTPARAAGSPSANMMPENNDIVDALLSGSLLVLSPHMDDEILGCGVLMARHRQKERIHCLFATDGAESPAPLLPWDGEVDRALPAIREQEARDALGEIGIPGGNIAFLGLPDGRLGRHGAQLCGRIEEAVARAQPEFVLVPFRYDRHPDHIAVNRAVRRLARRGKIAARVLEYFVYIRWRFLPGRDIRKLVSKERLIVLETDGTAELRRRALARYRSQTEICYDWQSLPILSKESIDWRCAQPEVYLDSKPDEPLTSCFPSRRLRILGAHYLERWGKRRKDQLLALARPLLGQR